MTSNNTQGTATRTSWQEQLQGTTHLTSLCSILLTVKDHCSRAKLPQPVFNIVSDRRGTPTLPVRPTSHDRLKLLHNRLRVVHTRPGRRGGANTLTDIYVDNGRTVLTD